MREFEVINRFFDRPTANRSWIRKGIGDDGAVLTPSPGFDSVVVTDTSVEGLYPPRSPPEIDSPSCFSRNFTGGDAYDLKN